MDELLKTSTNGNFFLALIRNTKRDRFNILSVQFTIYPYTTQTHLELNQSEKRRFSHSALSLHVNVLTSEVQGGLSWPTQPRGERGLRGNTAPTSNPILQMAKIKQRGMIVSQAVLDNLKAIEKQGEGLWQGW